MKRFSNKDWYGFVGVLFGLAALMAILTSWGTNQMLTMLGLQLNVIGLMFAMLSVPARRKARVAARASRRPKAV